MKVLGMLIIRLSEIFTCLLIHKDNIIHRVRDLYPKALESADKYISFYFFYFYSNYSLKNLSIFSFNNKYFKLNLLYKFIYRSKKMVKF